MQIRLNSVYPAVDHIVVVESAMSHQGAFKPLHYQENATRFARFADKIIHVALDYLPGTCPTISTLPLLCNLHITIAARAMVLLLTLCMV